MLFRGWQVANQVPIQTELILPTVSNIKAAIDDISSPRSNHTDSHIAIHDISSPRKIMGQYQACMLELQEIMFPKILQFKEDRKPIPVNVRIIGDRYYVLLLVFHVQHLRAPFFAPLRDALEISCNGIKDGTMVGRRRKLAKNGRKTLNDVIVVECPEAVNPAGNPLSNLTVVIPPYSESRVPTTFAFGEDMLGKMDECERLDISYFKQINQKTTDTNADERNVKIGAAIVIRGYLHADSKDREWRDNHAEGRGQAKSMREQAIEYAEYHHLLGVDHVWIYINEAWDNGRDLPHRDYITWVPFDWNLYNYKNFTTYPDDHRFTHNMFRCAGAIDAIWRARREGMDWILLNDVDEYVRIGHLANQQCPNSECGSVGSLSRFMRNYTDLATHGIAPRYKENGGQFMAGIRLESLFFGRNVELVDQDDDMRLLIDYVWKRKFPPGQRPEIERDKRRKMIVDPSIVVSLYIHDITAAMKLPFVDKSLKPGKGTHGLIRIPDDVIRINHYKLPHTGVMTNHDHTVTPGNVEKDTLLKDQFHDLLMEALAKDRSFDGNLTDR
jgi:hypothetical protein